jgi:hypothetical protein
MLPDKATSTLRQRQRDALRYAGTKSLNIPFICNLLTATFEIDHVRRAYVILSRGLTERIVDSTIHGADSEPLHDATFRQTGRGVVGSAALIYALAGDDLPLTSRHYQTIIVNTSSLVRRRPLWATAKYSIISCSLGRHHDGTYRLSPVPRREKTDVAAVNFVVSPSTSAVCELLPSRRAQLGIMSSMKTYL